MIIGLLLIALICLAVGLVLPSVAWLIASLIATAGAAYLLLKARSTILAPAAAARGASAEPPVADRGAHPGESDPGESDPADPGEPEPTHAELAEAAAAEPTADSAAPDVTLEGETMVMPAVVEDSQQPWSAHSQASDVWVIDGRPRYHLSSCAIIQGQDAEPIPFDQATEDGFMPCSLCEPSAVRAGR